MLFELVCILLTMCKKIQSTFQISNYTPLMWYIKGVRHNSTLEKEQFKEIIKSPKLHDIHAQDENVCKLWITTALTKH